MDHKDMTRFDDKTESHKLLCHYEEDGVFYYVHRFVSKKNIFMNGKEIILANAFKKLDNGRYVDVFKSIEDPDFVRGHKKLERVEIKTAVLYYEPFVHATDVVNSYYNVTFYQFMDPCIKIGLKIVKAFLGGHFKRFYNKLFPVIAD